MKKSSTSHLLKCYIWLINTIARGPISRAEIDSKWAHSDANDYKTDAIPESTFFRWKDAIWTLFDIEIKCNAYNEYYIEDAANVRKADMREHMINIMNVNSLIKDSEEIRSQILFEPVPSGEKFLAPIIEALRDKCAIQITHQSFGRSENTFIVEPYCLKMFKQRWYMLAHSPELDSLRIYSLDRILAIEPTKQKYKLPDDFDAETYFKDTYGVTGMDKKPEEIKICIDVMQANYLRTLPLHPSQEEIERNDDYSIFRFHMVPSYEFVQELRKYGPDLTVLAPNDLREQFEEEAEMLRSNYSREESWV